MSHEEFNCHQEDRNIVMETFDWRPPKIVIVSKSKCSNMIGLAQLLPVQQLPVL